MKYYNESKQFYHDNRYMCEEIIEEIATILNLEDLDGVLSDLYAREDDEKPCFDGLVHFLRLKRFDSLQETAGQIYAIKFFFDNFKNQDLYSKDQLIDLSQEFYNKTAFRGRFPTLDDL